MIGFSCNYKDDIPEIAYNDLYLSLNGNIITTSDNENVIENCYHALELNLGEYWFNTQFGINWQLYLSSNTPKGIQIKNAVIKSIMSVNGVDRVSNYNMNIIPITRQLIIEVVIILNSGATATLVRSF